MLKISPIPAFEDNYLWLLEREGYDGCAIVDPGDANPVIETIRRKGLRLDAILITHKHGDHIGGVKKLKSQWPDAVVYGPRNEPINELEVRLGEGDRVHLDGLELDLDILDVPGHTEGHIAYYGHDSLFCGDTLFAGGCGRVFSGTHTQLSQSLQKITALPGDTLAYCAHEYTMANLGFAKWVEPDNATLQQREMDDAARRKRDEPTVPSSIATELATNPFMRTDNETVIRAAEKWVGKSLPDRDAVFHAVREWKDRDYD
ncbi:MAG: hydroxyacylglutathione hydrolase [Gammaproteobacteria bacterium]|nr:hydroxyacylglutathione hydrolase [Gammaproteobacteria bacterium]